MIGMGLAGFCILYLYNGKKEVKLDVICLNKNKLSRYEVEDSLTVEIILPNKYSDVCEIAVSVKLLG